MNFIGTSLARFLKNIKMQIVTITATRESDIVAMLLQIAKNISLEELNIVIPKVIIICIVTIPRTFLAKSILIFLSSSLSFLRRVSFSKFFATGYSTYYGGID